MSILLQGIEAYKAKNIQQARKLLYQAIQAEPNNEKAWGWFYNVAANDKERIACLKNILRINPQNERAQQILEKLTTPVIPDYPLDPPAVPAPAPEAAPPKAVEQPAPEPPKLDEFALRHDESPLTDLHILSPFEMPIYSVVIFCIIGLGIWMINYIPYGYEGPYFTALVLSIIVLLIFLTSKKPMEMGRFTLTDQRLFGFANDKMMVIKLEDMRDIQIHYPLAGKLFSYGNLLITVNGYEETLEIRYLQNPEECAEEIRLAAHRWKQAVFWTHRKTKVT